MKRSISREEHASITRRGESIVIQDNSSVNGTMLNGVVLRPYEKYRISISDVVIIGRTRAQDSHHHSLLTEYALSHLSFQLFDKTIAVDCAIKTIRLS